MNPIFYFGKLSFSILVLMSTLFSSGSCQEPKEEQPALCPDTNVVYRIVRDMPRFPGCEQMEDKAACAQEKMQAFIDQNLVYPAAALDNKKQWTVLVQTIILQDGSKQIVGTIADPGYGMAEEALRVVQLMPDFIPGTHCDKPVKVYIIIPVKFKL